jgi:hypothetical protein
VIDSDPELIGPASRPGGLEVEAIDREGRKTARGWIETPDDDGLSAAVQEEITHRETECAVEPEPAEGPLEITEAVDGNGKIGRPAQGAPDEGGDGGGDTGDGVHTAWDFFDIDTGVSGQHWHESDPFCSLGKSCNRQEKLNGIEKRPQVALEFSALRRADQPTVPFAGLIM